MQMGENVAILFIFFILLIISLVFYARLTETRIGIKQEEAFAGEAIQIAQRVASLPETQCSKNNIVEENCYDLYKLAALEEINQLEGNRVHYFNTLGFSTITVRQVFPQGTWSKTMYDNPITDFVEKSSIQIPIAVCDFTFIPEKCIFTIMTIDVFRA